MTLAELRLPVAVAGSVLLHLAVLTGFWGMLLPAARIESSHAPVQARLIAPSRVVVVSPVVPAPAPAPVEAAVVDAAVVAAAPAPVSEPRQAPSTSKPALPPPVLQPSTPAAASAAAAAYRTSASLDPPPRPLGDIEPEYPAAAGLQQGTVVIRLFIGATGDVDSVEIVSAAPEGLFEASAIEAFAKAKFSPGRYLGMAVKSQVTISVDYTPTNRGGAVSGQSSDAGLRR